MRKRERSKQLIIKLVAILLTLLWLYPFYLIVVNSFKTKAEIFQNTLNLPENATLENYPVAFEKLDFSGALGTHYRLRLFHCLLLSFVHRWQLMRYQEIKVRSVLVCTL